MAEVAAVYDLTPAPRTIADILPDDQQRDAVVAAPVAAGKWLHASVTDDAAAVIAAGFDEACRRDPGHQRTWIALVDGNTHQIDRIRAEAKARKVTVTIVVDFIHVLEYVWKAAWCFHREGDPAAEQWVREQTRQILGGRAGRSPPASSKAPAVTSSKTASTSPAPAGASTAPKPSSNSAP